METRKITIISTKNNKRTVINTDATTLGELKQALRAAGVDYYGMTFYEGLTKTELKVDNSLLPHDVQRINPTTHKPEITNELAFMLTNTNKKIRSGAMTRSEVYAIIRANNLQAECQKRFGKNFTMCKTADLISLIDNRKKSDDSGSSNITPHNSTVCVDGHVRVAIRELVDTLSWNGTIDDDKKEEILSILDEDNAPVSAQTGDFKPSSGSPYSDDELDAMFKDMPR